MSDHRGEPIIALSRHQGDGAMESLMEWLSCGHQQGYSMAMVIVANGNYLSDRPTPRPMMLSLPRCRRMTEPLRLLLMRIVMEAQALRYGLTPLSIAARISLRCIGEPKGSARMEIGGIGLSQESREKREIRVNPHSNQPCLSG